MAKRTPPRSKAGRAVRRQADFGLRNGGWSPNPAKTKGIPKAYSVWADE